MSAEAGRPVGQFLAECAFAQPETGARIAGAVLPGWREIAGTALAAARWLPDETSVEWDVGVGVDGRPVVIEGTENSDPNLLQVHGGLLAEPGMRRRLERCRVL